MADWDESFYSLGQKQRLIQFSNYFLPHFFSIPHPLWCCLSEHPSWVDCDTGAVGESTELLSTGELFLRPICLRNRTIHSCAWEIAYQYIFWVVSLKNCPSVQLRRIKNQFTNSFIQLIAPSEPWRRVYLKFHPTRSNRFNQITGPCRTSRIVGEGMNGWLSVKCRRFTSICRN